MEETIEISDKITSKSAVQAHTSPYPGLRPYQFRETHLYFGQDEVTQRILNQLIDNRFVSILGGAGVGKTSILNCGIKPYFVTGLIGSSDAEWRIIHTRPSNNPISNLANTFTSSEYPDYAGEDYKIQSELNYNVLKRGTSGLCELINQTNNKNHRYLFLIDQFEDIFRYKNAQGEAGLSDEAFEYVNLIVTAIQQKDLPIYFVLVVRSDFADDCLIFPQLSGFINKSNVLVPRMTRNQLKEIILNPLALAGIKIDPALMHQILNDASNSDDLLPRIQHTLLRTWESWMILDNPDKPLSLTEYEMAGGLKNSISNYANEIYNTLSEEEKKECEKIFKTLTERGTESKGFTRATSIREICEITQASFEDVVKIVELFRVPSAGFLLPAEGELKPETIIDITHSSLSRTWNLLRLWVQDEAISSQMYRQLSESSAQYQIGKIGLLRPPDLQLALNWQEKQKPTVAWAKRYNPAFERTMVYLRTSLESYNAEEAFKKLQARKQMKKVRSLTIVLGSTAILALFITVYSQFLRRKDSQKLKLVSIQKEQLAEKSQLAEKASQEYLIEKRRAEIAALDALKQKDEAVTETKVLTEQKSQAELTAQEALQKTSMVQQNLEQITQQKQLAEKTAIQEAQQRSEAEKEKNEAFRKRMQNIAQTLAVKSIQSKDRSLKALLSLHSYNFNSRFNNSDINPDIYNALYGAVNDNGGITRYSLKGHIGMVKALVGQPRSNYVYSTGSDGKVLRWTISDDLKAPQTILQTSYGNSSLSITQNGRYLAVGTDIGIINIIDLQNPGAPPQQLKGHQSVVYSVAFTPDGLQLFSTGADKKILLWDMDSRTSSTLYQENASVKTLSVSSDGKFLAGGTDDGQILIWDNKANQFSIIRIPDNISVFASAFSPNTTMLAVGDAKGNIYFYNPYSKKLLRSLQAHNGRRVTDIRFNSTGELVASTSFNGSIVVFDTRFLGNAPIILSEPSSYTLAAVFSNDSRKIIIGTSKQDFIYVWPAQPKPLVEQLCSKITRTLSQDEWNSYIGPDIKYEKPCD